MNNKQKVSYMKTYVLVFTFLNVAVFATGQVNANITYPKDSLIKVQIIDPFEKEAARKKQSPNWEMLTKQIASKYDSAFADRVVNKAEISYDASNDWAAFTRVLIRYTEKYEDQNDLQLLNKNANMVLQYFTDKSELVTALSWSKHTVDKEPGNPEFQKTYQTLKDKIERFYTPPN